MPHLAAWAGLISPNHLQSVGIKSESTTFSKKEASEYAEVSEGRAKVTNPSSSATLAFLAEGFTGDGLAKPVGVGL